MDSIFAKGILRWPVLVVVLTLLCLVPPEIFGRGPDLCLWRQLFHLSACPACGSTRALAAFFHGNLAQALAFNRNVVLTAPVLVGLLLDDLRKAVGRAVEKSKSRRVER